MNDNPHFYRMGNPYESHSGPIDPRYYAPYDHYYRQPENQANYMNPQQTPYEMYEKPPLSMNMENEMRQSVPKQRSMPGFMTNFQNENGQLDIDRMLSTVGQFANTYHQVYPIFKQIGGLIKTFNKNS
jgi:hypothetical protein